MRHPRERGRKGAPPTREEGQSSPLPLLPPTTTTPPFSTQKLGEHHQGKSGENSTSSKDDDTLRARGEPTSHRGLLARMFWTVSPLAACSPRRWEMEIWARALSAMEGRTREGGGRGGPGSRSRLPFFGGAACCRHFFWGGAATLSPPSSFLGGAPSPLTCQWVLPILLLNRGCGAASPSPFVCCFFVGGAAFSLPLFGLCCPSSFSFPLGVGVGLPS